jgi:hypothetical protein
VQLCEAAVAASQVELRAERLPPDPLDQRV